jgi:hypothetical protein
MVESSSAAGWTRRAVLRSGGLAAGALLLGPAARAVAAPTPAATSVPADVLHRWVEALYGSHRYAQAWPTLAARMYALGMLAGYEATVGADPSMRSLAGRLNGLGRGPTVRNGGVDWPIAANAAIRTVAVAQSFERSEQIRAALAAHGDAVHAELARGQKAHVVARAVEHGEAVGRWLSAWADGDGFRATRGLPYEPPVGPGLWRRTPPNNGAAIEPHWHRVRPFVLQVTRDASGYAVDPAAPPPPIPYDATPGSPFHQQAMAVHQRGASLTDADKLTAMYWRDNPDGVTGLPAGHWLQIADEVTIDAGLSLPRAARVLAVMAIGVADAFTSCWIEKYRSNVLRPVTYIQDHIDPAWASFVNSPAFPEYTSGHSTSSQSAATILTAFFGTRAFTDRRAGTRTIPGNGGTQYPLTPRTYASFQQAADEAAQSRLAGGIHYPMGIQHGLTQGARVAELVLQRLRPATG